MAPAKVFVNMTAGPQSGGRHSSPAALRALLDRFTSESAADTLIPRQLTAWSHARDRWRAQWNGRTGISPEVVFRRSIPSPPSAGQDQWTHPVADEAPELDSWRARWHEATPGEQKELSTAFVRAIALIETDAASLDDACALLAGSTAGHGLPLAALTPALSSLDPTRFVVLCDAWIRTLGEYERADLPKDVGGYPELNAMALRWLAAEGDAMAPVFVGSPPADRLGVFLSWVVRTNPGASADRKFDVTQKKYKDWPPMW
jgi:hypothetical protein